MRGFLQKIRGLLISSSLFCFLFILHILFASYGLWTLFKLVVISIFFVSHFHSLIALNFSRLNEKESKIFLIKISTPFSIIYSIGFWYAVNNMNLDLWVFFTGIIQLIVYLFLIRYLITDNSKEMTNSNDYGEPPLYS
ncbi:MAG: hypothetical protein CMB64_02030 [Euryarchaeota archaeon]|nr:hypothetical protein [Euryarchaeota archaeon]